jgi:cell division septation protein DedD
MKRTALIILALAAAVIGAAGTARAQNADAEIRPLIESIERGGADAARSALPDLIARYQSSPGVIYLQGRLSADGVEAAKHYQSVVDNYPKSEWADDALYSLYQYYYAMGLYKSADLKLQQLKREYPASPYLSARPPSAPAKGDSPLVTVPAKDPVIDTVPSVADVSEPPKGPFTLQVGAFSTAKNAEKQKDFFDDLEVEVEVTNKVRSGRSLYLVWVGRFASAVEAKEFSKEIKKKYKIDSIVVERY